MLHRRSRCLRSSLDRNPLSLFLLFAPVTILICPAKRAWGQSVGQAGSGEAGKGSAIQASLRYVPTLKRLPRDILADQKFLWVRPFRLKRDDIPLVVGLVGTTAGLIAIDKHVAQSLADSPPGSGFAFSHRVSQAGGLGPQLVVCSTFYLLGHWRDNERSRTTGLLGMRAVLDAVMIVEGLKRVSQRPRPTTSNGVSLNHNADGEFFTGGNAFPSGHAMESWALAYVTSNQYQEHRWVPPVAYGLAGLVSVARVTGRRHFPSDVFVGAALGTLIGRHISHEASAEKANATKSSRLLPKLWFRDGSSFELAWRF